MGHSIIAFLAAFFLATTIVVAILIWGTIEALFLATKAVLDFLVANWIVQTIFAGWIALAYQRASSEASRRNEILEATYHRQMNAANDLYSLVDRRIYASREYLATILTEPKRIDAVREEYRGAVRDWNEGAPKAQTTLLMELPSSYGMRVDHVFNPGFLELDGLLRRQRLLIQADRAASTILTSRIRRILSEVHQTRIDDMRDITRIAKYQRLSWDNEYSTKRDRVEHLSTWQLAKAVANFS